MMIKEALDRAAHAARQVKQDYIGRCRPGDNTDIMTFVEGYRGAESVVTLGMKPDRDNMLLAMTILASAFSADVVAVTMETFHASTEDNPLTNERWGPGEMSKVAAEHDGIAKGWVQEALVTQVANRAGDEAGIIQPYVIGQMGRRVTLRWAESTKTEDHPGMKMQGLVPEAIEEIMGQPTLEQLMTRDGLLPHDLGLSAEAARAHQDLAGLRVLRERLGGVLVTVSLPYDPRTERGQILARRLREMENEQ